MGLLDPLGVLAVVFLGSLWAFAKLIRYRLAIDDNSDRDRDAVDQLISQVSTLTYTAILVIVVVELWPGLASFAGDAYQAIITTL